MIDGTKIMADQDYLKSDDYKKKYDDLMKRCAEFMQEFAPPSPYDLGFKAGWEAAKKEFYKDNTYVPDTTKPATTMDIQWPRDKMAWPWPPTPPTTTNAAVLVALASVTLVTLVLFLIVVLPEVAPIVRAVAAPAILTVLAILLIKLKLAWLVVKSPPRTSKSPSIVVSLPTHNPPPIPTPPQT
jgi:hypothetical protein